MGMGWDGNVKGRSAIVRGEMTLTSLKIMQVGRYIF